MMRNKKRLQIDTDRCMGCCACEIACKMENELPRGVRFIVMRQSEDPAPLKEKLVFSFDICRHCEDPACARVCPAHAVYVREDGIVLVDEFSCIGCGICRTACPWEIPQIGDKGIMQKCSMCAARLDRGLLPACQNACPAGAIRLMEV